MIEYTQAAQINCRGETLSIQLWSVALIVTAVLVHTDSSAADLNSAAKAQSQLITARTNRISGEDAVRNAQLRMSQKIQDLGYQLFMDAKRAGLKMENPSAHLEQVNRERRSAGVWDLNVATTKAAGLFLLLNELDARLKEPAFAIAGYGLLRIETQLIDDDATSIGRLSKECRVQIQIDTEEMKYSCQEFLSTASESKILGDLKAKLALSIEHRARIR